MEELITLEQLKDYDLKKGKVIQKVDALPSIPENRIYCIPHSYEDEYQVHRVISDLLGSFYTLQSNGKYTLDPIYTVKYQDQIMGSIFVSGSNVSVYEGRDFTGLYAWTLNTSTAYDFDVTETVDHLDFFAGNSDTGKFTKLANVDQVEDFFIRKSQKGSAGGVATLDADGRVPAEQLPISALVYQGQWDASTGAYPEDGTTIGDFYIVSVAGTVEGIEFDIGDWIIWNGTIWDKSENANDVTSVNGQKGAVVLYGSNIACSEHDPTTIQTEVHNKVDSHLYRQVGSGTASNPLVTRSNDISNDLDSSTINLNVNKTKSSVSGTESGYAGVYIMGQADDSVGAKGEVSLNADGHLLTLTKEGLTHKNEDIGVLSSGINWSSYSYLGDGAGGGIYINKYKAVFADGTVVNIQTAPTSGKPAIYFTHISEIVKCDITVDSSGYEAEGSGIWVFLENFYRKESKFSINGHPVWVYYEGGYTENMAFTTQAEHRNLKADLSLKLDGKVDKEGSGSTTDVSWAGTMLTSYNIDTDKNNALVDIKSKGIGVSYTGGSVPTYESSASVDGKNGQVKLSVKNYNRDYSYTENILSLGTDGLKYNGSPIKSLAVDSKLNEDFTYTTLYIWTTTKGLKPVYTTTSSLSEDTKFFCAKDSSYYVNITGIPTITNGKLYVDGFEYTYATSVGASGIAHGITLNDYYDIRNLLSLRTYSGTMGGAPGAGYISSLVTDISVPSGYELEVLSIYKTGGSSKGVMGLMAEKHYQTRYVLVQCYSTESSSSTSTAVNYSFIYRFVKV